MKLQLVLLCPTVAIIELNNLFFVEDFYKIVKVHLLFLVVKDLAEKMI